MQDQVLEYDITSLILSLILQPVLKHLQVSQYMPCTLFAILNQPSFRRRAQALPRLKRPETVLQKEADIVALEERLQAQRRQTEAASAEAKEQSDLLASWRQAQAELMRTLPRLDGSRRQKSTVEPTLGSMVPKQCMLRFEKGPPSPITAFASCHGKPKQSPLEVFREVYKNQPLREPPQRDWDDSASVHRKLEAWCYWLHFCPSHCSALLN
jgi:hypothetical protein